MSDDLTKRLNAPSWFPKRILMPGFRKNGFVSLDRELRRTPLESSIELVRAPKPKREVLDYPDDPKKPAVAVDTDDAT